MSKQWLEETENLIHSIEQECKVLSEEYEKLGTELTTKEAELAHWQAVIQSYRNRQQSPQPSLFLQELDTYTKLSHKEILLLIRNQNEGFIPMKQVTEVLKHKVVNPNHAASAAYSTVRRMVKQGKVIRVNPGLYRWVNGAT